MTGKAVKRSARSETRQVAALPWRIGASGREVLMITSRETRRWVIPKGGRMAGKTDPQAAAVEAMEEAGVQGRSPRPPSAPFVTPNACVAAMSATAWSRSIR